MKNVEQYRISTSGQMSLPASARRRWGLTTGGPVDVIDLGFGVLTAPVGTGAALLDDLLSADDHSVYVDELDDPELATT